MTRILSAAVAATAITGIAGTAQAAQVCQWTGSDWACGDGNIVQRHIAQNPGPPIIITPVPTVASNEKPLLQGPREP